MDKKAVLAGLFAKMGLSAALRKALWLGLGPHARAVNYHDVPADHAGRFEEQLAWYRERFEDCGERQLTALLSGHHDFKRPLLLVSLDDGLRSASEVAAPLLERYGFTGWFMVPVAFIDCPPKNQVDFAREHRIQVMDSHPDGRVAMTWEELRKLSNKHVITCHSMTHRRLGADLSQEDLELEIRQAKDLLEQRLGVPVKGFTWVGGEEWSYSAGAAHAIRDAGYQYSFMTNNLPVLPGSNRYQLQRTNIEAWFPLEVVDFQLSGFMDLFYFPKRRRVNRLTAT